MRRSGKGVGYVTQETHRLLKENLAKQLANQQRRYNALLEGIIRDEVNTDSIVNEYHQHGIGETIQIRVPRPFPDYVSYVSMELSPLDIVEEIVLLTRTRR